MESTRGVYERLAKKAIKNTIWKLVSVKGKKRGITIFTSRRSGGTWLLDAIGAQSKTKSVGQPLSIKEIFRSEATIGIPIFNGGQIVEPSDREKENLKMFIFKIMSGDICVGMPWRFWKSTFSWRANKIVMKITDANPIIYWFSKNFETDILYLSRHPIPQSLSCIRLGWETTCLAYLRSQRFVNKYLSKQQEDECWRILSQGNEKERFVLNWCLENIVPLRMEECPFLHISYENAVMNPEETVGKIDEYLNLDNPDVVKNSMGNKSRTVDSESEAESIIEGKITQNDKEKLVARWKDKVNDKEESNLMSILSMLDIEIYKNGKLMPVKYIY